MIVVIMIQSRLSRKHPRQTQRGYTAAAGRNSCRYYDDDPALHVIAICEGKPPFMGPKGSKGKPYGPPPLEEWAKKLLDKRLIKKNETGDENVRFLVIVSYPF